MAYTMLPQEDDGMNGYGGNGLSYYTGASTTLPSGYYGDPVALPGGGWTTEQTNPTTPARNERTQGLYAGYGYDVDQWNKRMDAKSAAEDAIRMQQGVMGGSGGSRSYGSPAQYAASQPMAFDERYTPQVSLATPQYKQWNSAEEQSEVYKAASPMIRENRRRMDALRASLSGLDPTMRRLQQKDIMAGYGDALSKTFGTANQVGGQRYVNKLNYDNQQTAQNTQIANQQAIANDARKWEVAKYNAALGETGRTQPKYRPVDWA